jgi:hypothetical protein
MHTLKNESDPLCDSANFPGLTRSKLRILTAHHLHRRWLGYFLRLKLFKDTFRRLPLQKEEFPKGFKIGHWTHSQRGMYKSGKMPLWRYKLLSSLEFNWGRRREDWECIFKRAVVFQRKKGTPIGRYGVSKEERSLKLWLYHQNERIKRGELSKERVAMLRDAGLIVNRGEYTWVERFADMKEFIEYHGRPPSGWSRDPHEKSLGKWRGYQTSLLKQGRLSPKRMLRLNNLGCTQRIADIIWERKYKKTVSIVRRKCMAGRFFGKNGLYKALGNELYIWLRTQRRKYRNNTLLPLQQRKIKEANLHLRIAELARTFGEKS